MLDCNGKFVLWSTGTCSVEAKKHLVLSEENIDTCYKSLAWTYLTWKDFLNLLSFYKLPITWYVPALIYLKGLFESRVADAPVQPSQRSTSVGASALCPFQRQSFFDQVHQSLKKDSLAIESALRVQRPRSTSSAQAGRFTNLSLLKDKSISVSIWSSSF